VRAHTVRLWAPEFDDGALDAFAKTLCMLKNTTLTEADICDVSKSEPDDRIRNSKIEAILSANRKNKTTTAKTKVKAKNK